MFSRLRRLLSGAWQRFRALPLAAALALGVVVFVGFTAAGIWGYQKWDYIENDNNFCLDCHLMAEPFELFGMSAHRDMSCKACHNPSMINRSKMGLTQILMNPDSLTVHAEVPNEACASCHVYGDPEEWNLIARSRGHRVHLESDDPELVGLMCVECHSTSVHRFTSTDATCRECHEETDLITGGMHDVAMNCGSCHAFNAPLPAIPADDPLRPAPEDALRGALTPGAGECLSCHVMRSLVVTPEDDPHEAACGACHNPHTQATAEAALESCATAGCHDEPLEDVSPFHVGLAPEALESCSDCHSAHTFHAEGQDCLACHTDVFEDSPGTGVRSSSGTDGGQREGSGLPSGVHDTGVPLAAGALPGVGFVQRVARSVARAAAQPGAQDATFRHGQHRDLDCLSCHSMDGAHGAVTVRTLDDCRRCHHTTPTADDCATCHTDAGVGDRTFPTAVTFELSVGDTVGRTLPFDHADHGSDCATCHTTGLGLAADDVDCTTCHAEHHEPDSACSTCHAPSPRPEHTVDAHLGCGGSGCHADPPFRGVPRERSLCLVCHVEQVDHQTDRPETCADCHVLPDARAPAGVRR